MSLVYDNSKSDSSFASVLSRVIQPFNNGAQQRGIGGLRGSSRSFFLSSLWREHPTCLLVITPTLKDAEDCYQELLFLQESMSTLFRRAPKTSTFFSIHRMRSFPLLMLHGTLKARAGK